MGNSPEAAIRWATTIDRTFPGLCDHFVGRAYGWPNSGFDTAMDHWRQTPDKAKYSGDRNPPVGSLVYWETGKPAGHVAIVTGKDRKTGRPLVTTTHLNGGKPTTVPLDSIGMNYLGWGLPYFRGKVTKLPDIQGVSDADGVDNGDTSGLDYTYSTIDPTYVEQDTLSMKDLKGTFGIAAGVLKRFPELKDVFKEILAGGITDPSRQIAMVMETDWWRKHTDQWMTIEKSRLAKDPGVWKATVLNQAERIKDQFVQAGAEIDDATAVKYAKNMIYGSGWDGDSFTIYDTEWLTDQMVSAIDFEKTKTIDGIEVFDFSGKAEETANSLYEMARDYGMDTAMSNTAFTAWFQKSMRGLLEGTVASQDVDDELISNANSMFPALKSQLERGLTLRQAADPYLNQIANVLELDPGSLDLNDDLVQRVLNQTDEQGQFRAASLYDAKLMARKDERFQYTSKAKEEWTNIGNTILRDFGFLG